MLSRLTKISEEFNVAVYMTNQGNSYCHGIFDLVVCSLIQKASHLNLGLDSVFNLISRPSIPNVFSNSFISGSRIELVISASVGKLATQQFELLLNYFIWLLAAVIADPGGGVFISDPKKPAGGHVLAHAATIRLMFRKGKGEQRVCKVFDAPNLPEAEAISFSYHIILIKVFHHN